MIDALAEQLAWEWTADDIECDRPHPWKSPPVPKSLEENWRERYRASARRLLGAALGVCEVREGFAADTGDYVTTTPLDRAAAQREVDGANDHSRSRGNAPHTRLVRRLWITSPAEQVDP